jgi:hypothetical protein
MGRRWTNGRFKKNALIELPGASRVDHGSRQQVEARPTQRRNGADRA